MKLYTYQLLVSTLIIVGLLFRGFIRIFSAARLIHFVGYFETYAPTESLKRNFFGGLETRPSRKKRAFKLLLRKNVSTTIDVTSFQNPSRVKKSTGKHIFKVDRFLIVPEQCPTAAKATWRRGVVGFVGPPASSTRRCRQVGLSGKKK